MLLPRFKFNGNALKATIINDSIPMNIENFGVQILLRQHYVPRLLPPGKPFPMIRPAMLYGQETTTPTLYNDSYWTLNDLKCRVLVYLFLWPMYDVKG